MIPLIIFFHIAIVISIILKSNFIKKIEMYEYV